MNGADGDGPAGVHKVSETAEEKQSWKRKEIKIKKTYTIPTIELNEVWAELRRLLKRSRIRTASKSPSRPRCSNIRSRGSAVRDVVPVQPQNKKPKQQRETHPSTHKVNLQLLPSSRTTSSQKSKCRDDYQERQLRTESTCLQDDQVTLDLEVGVANVGERPATSD